MKKILLIIFLLVIVTGRANSQCTPPAKPIGLKATAVSSSQINLSWNAVSGAIGYDVSYCDGTYIGYVTGTTYSHTGRVASTNYSYKVQAQKSATCVSGFTTCASATTQSSCTPPAKPTGLTATAVSSSQINLSWNAVSGAIGYDISYCDGTYIGYVTGTTYSHTGRIASTNYSYIVQAQKSATCVSGFTTCASATTQTMGAPSVSAPANGSIYNVSSSLSLAWTTVLDATSYDVEFDVGQINTLITNVPTASLSKVLDVVSVGSHTWHVRAKNGTIVGTWSVLRTYTVTNTLTIPTLSAPTTGSTYDVGSTLKLVWTPVAWATSYDVEFDTGTTHVFQSNVTIASISSVLDAINIGPHTWHVRAKNGTIISDWSASRTYTVVTKLDIPTLLMPADNIAQSAVSYLTLKWTEVPGATAYDVEFDTGQTSAHTSNYVTGSTTIMLDLNNVGSHTWHVRAKNGTNIGAWSVSRSYTNFLTDKVSEYLVIGKYKIYGDKIIQLTNSQYEIEGNVSINGILKINGKLSINKDELSVKGNGRIFLDRIPVVGFVDIYNGNFALNLADGIDFRQFDPDNMGIKLCKLPLTIDKLAFIEEGVQIYGKLKLPELFNTVDAEITTLEITRKYGLRLVGTIEVKDIKIHSLQLDELGLDFNSIEDYFSASAHLTTPFFGIGASTEIKSGKMNSIHIDVAPPNPVALGTTGLSISKIKGGVDNMIEPPLILTISVDLVPSVQGDFEIVKLSDLSLRYSWGKEFNGSGNVQIFDKDMANVYLNIQSNKVAFGGEVSLYDVLKGKLDAAISNENNKLFVNGHLYASLIIPALEGWPFDKLNGSVGLPYTVAETDNYLANNIIAGNTKIKSHEMHYKAEWVNKKLDVDFGKGYENWNQILFGSKNLLKTKSLSLNRFEGKSLLLNSSTSQINLKKSRLNYEQVFNLQQTSRTLDVRVYQGNNMPDCSIKMPDGTIVTKSNVNNKNQFYVENAPEKKVFFQFDNPPLGNWTIIAKNMNENIFVDIIGADLNSSLMLDSIQQKDSEIIIPYRGFSKNTSSILSVFYDDDFDGFNGIKIADVTMSNEKGEIRWSTSKMPYGRYSVYGILDDKTNSPIKVYSPNSISVKNSNPPLPPYNLKYNTKNDSLILSWNYYPDLLVNYNVYYNENDNFSNTTRSLNASSNNNLVLPDLTSGKTYYFRVTAIDKDNIESNFSEYIKVIYNKKTQNNPPFLSKISTSGTAYVDSIYIDQVYGTDVDGDPLTYFVKSAPEKLSMTTNGIIYWKPNKGDVGFHTFYAFVTDNKNAIDSIKLNITVNNNIIFHPKLESNKSTYISNCDLPLISLSDIMIKNNPDIMDSVMIRINSHNKYYEEKLFEESVKSQTFRGKINLLKARQVLSLNSSDTLIVSYNNYKYNTSDSIKIVVNNHFDKNTIDLSGSYSINSGESLKVSAADGFNKYTWFKNNEPEVLSTNRTYNIISSGIYFIKVEDDFGCFSYSDKITVNVNNTVFSEIISVNESIKIYPTPTSGMIIIEGLPTNQKSNLAVYSADGKLIMKKSTSNSIEELDISKQVPGIYLLDINNQSVKIIKK